MLTGKTIDRDSQQKLYVQIYDILKSRIEERDWPEGSRIPTEDDLCRTYDVSKATVRIAVSDLVRNGYLKRQQGKGTFVNYSISLLGMHMKTTLTENMFGGGVNARKEILVKGVKEPDSDIRNYLKFDRETYYILCKRVVDDNPAFLEESFFPLMYFPEIEGEDICRKSFYALVEEQSAQRLSRIVQTIEITDLDGDAADILKVRRGAAGLLLHRLLIASSGSPIAYTRLIGASRTYKIQTEFEKIR
jgi:DNA-binding GntR family transcriptional regulator